MRADHLQLADTHKNFATVIGDFHVQGWLDSMKLEGSKVVLEIRAAQDGPDTVAEMNAVVKLDPGHEVTVREGK